MNKGTFASRTGDIFIDTLCNRTGNQLVKAFKKEETN